MWRSILGWALVFGVAGSLVGACATSSGVDTDFQVSVPSPADTDTDTDTDQ